MSQNLCGNEITEADPDKSIRGLVAQSLRQNTSHPWVCPGSVPADFKSQAHTELYLPPGQGRAVGQRLARRERAARAQIKRWTNHTHRVVDAREIRPVQQIECFERELYTAGLP